MTGYIHSIETMGLVDGPGVRTVVFLKGCPLRCLYCHNPDSWSGAGEEMEPQNLLKKILRFRSYYKASGGGVTFSGGEPLGQPAFLAQCLELLKAQGIHTCIDTSGVGQGDYGAILKHTDLILYDVKHITPKGYHQMTGGDMASTQEFIRQVRAAGTPMWVRHVVVPGLTDSEAHIESLASYVSALPNVQRVEMLPYHTAGGAKYKALGLEEPLLHTQPMDKALCAALQEKYFSQIERTTT